MERVQYSLESSLPELKDLQVNGIFSPLEIREIIKRRTHFETQLVRRQPRKKDFLEYIEYEMALEKLRKRRCDRLKTHIPHSLSSHSLIQRQFSLFERAMRKFQGDLRLWIQYIEVVKREGASNLMSRVVARALKLHPSAVALYILAAQHELDQGSPSAARNLLQRGIRLNEESVELWCEYVKMELGWCEFLRRRWETLGINTGRSDLTSGVTVTEDVRDMDVESARKEVLSGAIVKEVLKDALNAKTTLKTFQALLSTLKDYPTTLAPSLIPYLYQVLAQIPSSRFKDTNKGHVLALHASRHFHGLNLSGAELVNGLKLANEELITLCNESSEKESRDRSNTEEREQILIGYAHFVTTQWQALLDPNLRLYLASSLHNLCRAVEKSPSRLDAGSDTIHLAHLRILLDSNHPPPAPTLQNLFKAARKYTIKSTNAEVWVLRLEVERRRAASESSSLPEELNAVARQARAACGDNGSEALWTWRWEELTLGDRENLLKESFSLASSPHTLRLQTMLFLRLLSSIYSTPTSPIEADPNKTRTKTVSRLLKSYLPKPDVYRHAFELEAALPAFIGQNKHTDVHLQRPILEEIYRLWVDAPDAGMPEGSNKADATFAYAAYLLNAGAVKEATTLVNNLFARAGSWSIRQDLEKKWRIIADGPLTEERVEEDSDDVMDDAQKTEEEAGDSDIEFVINE